MPPTLTLLPVTIPAGLLAIVLLWPRLRSGPSEAHLGAEVVISAVALAALLYSLMVAAERLPW